MNIVRVQKFFVVLLALFLGGCATTQEFYDPQTGRVVRNVDVDTATPGAVAINAGVGGVVGCGAGLLLGSVTGDPMGGCALGALAGGAMGGASTQKRTVIQPGQQPNGSLQQEQGYAASSRGQNSPCTDEYAALERETTSTVARKRQEAANYRATARDNEGADKVEGGISVWEANTMKAIRVRYQNCISQITSEPTQGYRQTPPQQPPMVFSQPAINIPSVVMPYYSSPYGYYNPYQSRGYYGWR